MSDQNGVSGNRLKLATWNVNSIRAREERLLEWLAREQPDILCLQELKVEEDEFPFDSMRAAGYEAAVYGQKSYNGVAVLAKRPLEDVERGTGDGDVDPQARLISADVLGMRVFSAYFPNGGTVGSKAYDYKLEWIARLREHLERTSSPSEPIVVAGDFNVAPRDIDTHNPLLWGGSVLCHEYARDAVRRLREWGLVDVIEKHHPEGGVYSWWDYQMRAFEKDNGLRIDHIYATAVLADRCVSAGVDRSARAESKLGKPSDHAPVVAEFDLGN